MMVLVSFKPHDPWLITFKQLVFKALAIYNDINLKFQHSQIRLNIHKGRERIARRQRITWKTNLI